MGKIATRYLEVHPWKIRETGFHPTENQVSESIFSIANEYSGVRGFFDEGSDFDSLLGTYFNGVYVYHPKQSETSYLGVTRKVHFMVNAVNWLKTKIVVDGIQLNLSQIQYTDFYRELDLKSGEYLRSFIWNFADGRKLKVEFRRLLEMERPWAGFQEIRFHALQGLFQIQVDCELDFATKHWNTFAFWDVIDKNETEHSVAMIGELPSKQRLYSAFSVTASIPVSIQTIGEAKSAGKHLAFSLSNQESVTILKSVVNIVEKNAAVSHHSLVEAGKTKLLALSPYEAALARNRAFYQNVWEKIDITIDGDPVNQQGIRYCLFQLTQTYHGYDPGNNIGAKGLTGEAYSGHAFWDTETYCLPFYLFNNPEAARSLLMYRYQTLSQAKARAKELDCKGACYPIATLSGEESCDLWQHASLQMQPSTAVVYGIVHYVQNTHDHEFLFTYGLEMLVEISRYVFSRGDYNHDKTHFGFYGVMGPDEFQMMVNHNTYTNYMGKMTLQETLKALNLLKKTDENKYNLFVSRMGISQFELRQFREAAKKMLILYDPQTKLFEQHQGYFDLPHIDVDQIPKADFPLYHHWTYDRIYRNDMIKQPDVLMLMFLKNRAFSLQEKMHNYEFYEPRCIHESSLSPSIHSVLAMELDKDQEALDFFGFATRLDLDNYNRNTHEGLHLTSIAASWVNIVYGFGGLRTDGNPLVIRPKIPTIWKKFSFRFVYFQVTITVEVTQKEIILLLSDALKQPIQIGDKTYLLTKGIHRFTRTHRRITNEKNRKEGLLQK